MRLMSTGRKVPPCAAENHCRHVAMKVSGQLEFSVPQNSIHDCKGFSHCYCIMTVHQCEYTGFTCASGHCMLYHCYTVMRH